MNKSKAKTKGPGRPSDPKALSFNSMAAAAAHIGEGCTVDLLKAAKRAGCPAFRQSRIYVYELTEWLKENKVDEQDNNSKEALQRRKLLAECLAKERENEIAEGKLVNIDEVAAINAKVDAHIVQSIKESFTNDALVQRLVGCPFAEIKTHLVDAVDACFAEIHMPENAPA